ncbi:hypothetical protein [Massilia putida]|uniref:hypothetical protein n=1 Tax=Massilia putida TaxID=1141883 RepID=UPI000950C3D2|nr:hypothetical protein [Massilia putida]
MDKSQRKAMIVVALIAVLALPVYLIVGVVTAPFGIGLLMLMNNHPWILNLYPFLFAYLGDGQGPAHYIDNAISLPLTVMQWIAIAWIAGMISRKREFRVILLYTVGTVVAFGVVTAALLAAFGVTLYTQAAHT